MAVYYRTKGFIFKKDDHRESDRKFTVFTKEFGKIEVLAKAIRKITSKLRAGIDIFSLSEIEFIQGKNYKTLTDAVKIEKFDNITRDIEKFKIACKISEVLDNFIKGQEKDEKIWNLIIETFEKLNSLKIETLGHLLKIENCKLKILYCYFLWNFFAILGYHPEVQKCVACGVKLKPDELYFSNKDGGVICGNCAKNDSGLQKISSDIIKILRLILKKDWQTLQRLKIEDNSQQLLKELSNNYYSHISSKY